MIIGLTKLVLNVFSYVYGLSVEGVTGVAYIYV